MTDNDKFVYEMASIEDLALLAQQCAAKERELKAKLRHKTRFDDDYLPLVAERNENMRRWKYLKERIQARQMKLF